MTRRENCIEPGAVNSNDFARPFQCHDEHGFQAKHMIGRHAIFQAMRAAGIERHIAADRANRLAGGIRRIVQAMRRGSERYLRVDDTRFNDGNPQGRIESQDAIQPIQGDDDAFLNRQRAARKTRPAAARDEGHLLFMAQSHQRHHFLGRLWNGHRQRARVKNR